MILGMPVGSGVTYPPQFLFHYNGIDGATGFVDSGNLGITWTRTADSNGGTLPVISTAQSKFGGSSGFFVEGALAVSGFLQGSTITTLADSLFTLESFIWIGPEGTNNNAVAVGFTDGSSVSGFFINNSPTGAANRNIGQAVGESVGTLTLVPVSTWIHVAMQRRTGNLWDFFIDGVLIQTRTIDYSFGVSAVPRIGYRFDGYLDETRFTFGLALYDPAGFTPPTAPFPPA
jgi:hypothetical protein